MIRRKRCGGAVRNNSNDNNNNNDNNDDDDNNNNDWNNNLFFIPLPQAGGQKLKEQLETTISTISTTTTTTRRDLIWKVPLGSFVVYGYGKLLSNALSRLGTNSIEYPIEHETRVEETIISAMKESILYRNRNEKIQRPSSSETAATATGTPAPLRVLEVGIGKECRLLRRGLYDPALADALLLLNKNNRIELTGVDIRSPSIDRIDNVRQRLQEQQWNNNNNNNINDIMNNNNKNNNIDFQFIKGDISIPKGLPYEDGYFDVIICCFTLCSVHDIISSIKEMKRVLRNDGGTFGYIEHVAAAVVVNYYYSDEQQQSSSQQQQYRLLEIQQQILDPLQHIVANNCHLHRYTDNAIMDTFLNKEEEPQQQQQQKQQQQPSSRASSNRSRVVSHERFLVDKMWPVSCQTCGVIQLIQS